MAKSLLKRLLPGWPLLLRWLRPRPDAFSGLHLDGYRDYVKFTFPYAPNIIHRHHSTGRGSGRANQKRRYRL